MKALLAGLVFAVIFASTVFAQRGRVDLKQPLLIASQGSFFVGGEKKALPAGRGGAAGGHVTVHQMYVQYQIDWIDRRVEKR